jgi:hypothetical protein
MLSIGILEESRSAGKKLLQMESDATVQQVKCPDLSLDRLAI